ncbi:MAG: hypothetical protein KA419_20180 [Acidobacteria bacterium]|nr:hypothetical protein [Acidobacteriota bacterium]
MKQLVDMERRVVLPHLIDWAFIMELQKVLPALVNSEIVQLNRDVVKAIPPQYKNLVKPLGDVLANRGKVLLAVSDVDVEGDDYKAYGTLAREDGSPLGFCKLVLLDKDLFENDYIGGVITGADGGFRISFGPETFNDFPWFRTKAIPNFIFRVFDWRRNHFEKVAELRPKPANVEKFEGKRYLIDFGVVPVSVKA